MPQKNVQKRPTLETIASEGNLGRPRMAELYRMFYVNGPGHGTMLSLPFDQLVEHGVGHTFKWARSADPRAIIELGNRGCFSALALSIGQAEKYQNLIRPDQLHPPSVAPPRARGHPHTRNQPLAPAANPKWTATGAGDTNPEAQRDGDGPLPWPPGCA